ncbi:MAG TPA: YicC/YloC family endoribonuclease [Nitrospira sp.]|nr:YicC/YloC family endoribonuclease [Nitrospira sp.]
MIRSMTGFGKQVTMWRETSVSVEMRSVNHRFLEVAVRLPRAMAELEDRIRKAVQKRCRRGRVDITVALHGGRTGEKTLQLDRSLAKQYHHALRDLKKSLRLGGTIDVGVLAGFRDIFALTDEPVHLSEVHGPVLDLVSGALGEMERMRCREGEALAEDFARHLERLRTGAQQIREKAPHLAKESYARMRSRIEKLMGTEIPDQQRLLQELAVFADRCDISEELVRLESHMVQFEQTLRSEEPVGKTLEFLLQEVGREVNTIGSKANDVLVAQLVVGLKAEVEKMREQVQNVE